MYFCFTKTNQTTHDLAEDFPLTRRSVYKQLASDISGALRECGVLTTYLTVTSAPALPTGPALNDDLK